MLFGHLIIDTSILFLFQQCAVKLHTKFTRIAAVVLVT